MLRRVVGLDHVLFGTDYPYLRRDLAVESLRHIANSAELSSSEKASVLGGAAIKLIPRLESLVLS
jgi:aminocarboxymuconate-semialdehyde decarboxylase